MSRAVLLAGFIWEPRGSNDPAETRKGVPLYNGTAAGFEVWAYRIGMKLGALHCVKDKDDKRQKLIEYGSQVIEGLCDDALLVAMDFGQDKLNRPDGVQNLVEIMRSAIR